MFPRETPFISRSNRARLLRPLLLASGLTLLIFALYELVERTWLSGMNLSTLHLLHIVRGVGSSLIVAGVVGWMILKAVPGFPGTARAEEEWAGRPTTAAEDRSEIHARWFIAMRWIAVVLAGFLAVISVPVFRWLPSAVWWPLVITVSALIGCNVLYLLLLRRRRTVALVLLAQGYVDLVILTVLLHFSGGVENPLSMVMVFHVIIGGILLSRRQCYSLAAAGSGLFALLGWAEWSETIGHYTLQLFPHFAQAGATFHPAHHGAYVASRAILQTVVLLLTAYFVTILAEQLRANERRLGLMADRALANRQLLERALETTGTGLRVLDRNLQALWLSNRWKGWFVCEAGETCPGCETLDRDDSPARRCLQDGRGQVTELVLDQRNCPPRLLMPGITQRIFQITTAPLFDTEGNLGQVVELAQEVTAQKEIQARVLQAGKLAAVGELAGQIAHEVNNPVAVISAKASLLLSDHRAEMSPKIAQELAKIAELAKRVAGIARGLLSYCRPSAATRIRLDVRGPIRKALAAIEEQAQRTSVRIDDRLPEKMPVVKGNPNELEQVFLNLFANALDAMPKGGWLTLSIPPNAARLPDGHPALAIEVADTGCGIAAEIREKIFEPFFTTKKERGGTGLGLSICLGVVRSHGGEIAIESKLWQSTRVTVTLPVDAPAIQGEPNHG